MCKVDGRRVRTGGTAGRSATYSAPHLRLIDFGSALDEETFASMYGPDGPSAAEQTPEYAPPEAVFASRWPGMRAVRAPLVAVCFRRPSMWCTEPWQA